MNRLCSQSKIVTVAQGWVSGKDMCSGKMKVSRVMRACFGDVSEIAHSRERLGVLIGGA